MARNSPVHDFKVRGPLSWRLDYVACQTEEGRLVFKRLLAFPAVQFNLTCAVIPQGNNTGRENRVILLFQSFVGHAVSPCVLFGKADIIH